jgi:hypothetical protein
MALVSTVYPPEMWALESLTVLRNELVMAKLVHRDFEAVVAQAGDKVHTRMPIKPTARAWGGQTGTDANETITVENPNARDLSITLDTVAYVSFLVEDKDEATSVKSLTEEFIGPSMMQIAEKVDDDIMTEFTATTSTDVYGAAVTAVANGTVGLEADFTEDEITAADLQLNTNQCPRSQRYLVLCPKHHTAIIKRDLFQQASQAGNDQTLRKGIVGNAFGFETYMSQNVPNAADTDATPQSLAFHRNAIALVTRPLSLIKGVESGVANFDGLSIRFVRGYEPRYMGTTITFSMLYGVQLLDAHLGVAINP